MKMKFFLAAVVFVVLATTGSYALKCYTCAGKGNSCKSGSLTCPAGFDRCVKFVLKDKNGNEAVLALCSNKGTCDRGEARCKELLKESPEMTKCGTYCCAGDNCNLSPKTSQVTLAVLVFGLLAATLLN